MFTGRTHRHIFRWLHALMTCMMICCVSEAQAINAAPAMAQLPQKLLLLSDAELLRRGERYERLQHPDSALLCYTILSDRESDMADNNHRRSVLRAKLDAGSMYYSVFYDYGKAYSMFQDMYKIAVEHNDSLYMALGLSDIANVLSIYNETSYSEKRNREILNTYKRSLDIAMSSRNWGIAILVMHNMISKILAPEDFKLLNSSLKRFLTLPMPDSVPGKEFARNRVRAYIAIAGKDYQGAARILHAMKMMEPGGIGEKGREIHIGYDLAELWKRAGRYDSLLYYAHYLQRLARSNDLYEVLPGTYMLEADAYTALGDTARRDKAFLDYYASKDSLMTLSNIALYSEPHLKNRIVDIDLQLHEVKAESRLRRTIIISSLMLIVVLAAFVIFTVYKNKVLLRKNREMVRRFEIIDRQEKIILHNTIEKMRREGEPEPCREGASEDLKSADGRDAQKEYVGNPELLARIIGIMENDPEIFNAAFSLDRLAAICGYKIKTVSAELNGSLGKNFNTLLNEYRVREMCRRLDSPESKSLTIEAISAEVGFRSRSTYTAAFKRLTGVTPSEYLKACRKKED